MEKEFARVETGRGTMIITNERLILIEQEREEIKFSDIRQCTMEHLASFGMHEYTAVFDIKFTTDTRSFFIGNGKSWESYAKEILSVMREVDRQEDYGIDFVDNIEN